MDRKEKPTKYEETGSILQHNSQAEKSVIAPDKESRVCSGGWSGYGCRVAKDGNSVSTTLEVARLGNGLTASIGYSIRVYHGRYNAKMMEVQLITWQYLRPQRF